MLIFYTVAWTALALWVVNEELFLLEDKAKKTDDFLVKLGYFVDWLAVVILFPVVIAIRKSYERELTSYVVFFSWIFNFLKEILAFLPRVILLFLVEVRKMLRL